MARPILVTGSLMSNYLFMAARELGHFHDVVRPSGDALRAEILAGPSSVVFVDADGSPELLTLRKERKDLYVVAVLKDWSLDQEEAFLAGLRLLKENSINLVFFWGAEFTMIITPEQSRYTDHFGKSLLLVIEMALARAEGTFARTNVVPGNLVEWDHPGIHDNLRAVVDYVASKGAFKDILGKSSTVGHYAQRSGKGTYLVSRRNNDHAKSKDMVFVRISEENGVVAYGAKPSAGAVTQRELFAENPDMDCVIHFHCPSKTASLPVRPQVLFECGSHECGRNTVDGLVEIEPGIRAVVLDKHGPNILFSKDTSADRVIAFIDKHFDLSRHTGDE